MPYFIWFFYFVILVFLPFLGWRLVRALERRNSSKNEIRELREEVRSLEQQIEKVVRELETLEEGQRFLTSALASRAVDRRPAEKS